MSKLILGAFLFALVAILPLARCQGDICCCANNAVEHEGHYYEFFSVPLNWWEARSVCAYGVNVDGQTFSYNGRQLTGDLLWLTDTRERDWIQFSIEGTWGSRQIGVWLGARRVDNSCTQFDRWMWTVYPAVIPPSGSPLQYSWNPSPSCHYGPEYCAAIWNEAVQWSDELCTKKLKFICKAPIRGPPSSSSVRVEPGLSYAIDSNRPGGGFPREPPGGNTFGG